MIQTMQMIISLKLRLGPHGMRHWCQQYKICSIPLLWYLPPLIRHFDRNTLTGHFFQFTEFWKDLWPHFTTIITFLLMKTRTSQWNQFFTDITGFCKFCLWNNLSFLYKAQTQIFYSNTIFFNTDSLILQNI